MFGSYVWKNVKRLVSLLFLLVLHLYSTEGNGAHVVLTAFTAGSVWGLCLSNFRCGFVTLAKNDGGPARGEKCGFLWENARKTHLNWH